MINLTHPQQTAIDRFKAKSAALGWAYEGIADECENGSVVLVFSVSGNRHWVRFSPTGNCAAVPVAMGCRGGVTHDP